MTTASTIPRAIIRNGRQLDDLDLRETLRNIEALQQGRSGYQVRFDERKLLLKLENASTGSADHIIFQDRRLKSFVPFEVDFAQFVVRAFRNIQFQIGSLNLVFHIDRGITMAPIKDSKIVSRIVCQR